MLYDHIDVRVSNLEKVRALYDALLPAMGFSDTAADESDINYYAGGDRSMPFFGLMLDPEHRANGSRIAFRAATREEVDRLAEIARSAGARAFEAPDIYDEDHPKYYAAFFEDADGNKLEICARG